MSALINDNVDEFDETIQVTLSAPSNASLGSTVLHTFTISDDDFPPAVGFELAGSSGSEGVAATNAVLGGNTSHIYTIIDNDPQVAFQLSGSRRRESRTPARLHVSLS